MSQCLARKKSNLHEQCSRKCLIGFSFCKVHQNMENVITINDPLPEKVSNNSKNPKSVDMPESLIKGALAKSIIDVAEVWFVGGKFGMSLRLIQSRVKVPQGLRGYSFLPSDDDDDDVEDGATTVKVEIGSDASEEEVPVSTTQDDIDNVSSSDDESSDDEEEAPPPVKRGKKTKKSG